MASHVFVLDSSARRHQIKTGPSTRLRSVLEEACQKFNKDPDQFSLTDSGRQPKTLDLSLTVRLAGLANGAKLQLVQASRSPAVISIALQLPESLGSTRVQDKFPSNTSLWLVLRKFEEAAAGDPPKKLNITQRGVPSTESGAGRLVYEQPVVNVMNRELSEFVDLQKTLMQLGFNSGSVLLRLTFRNNGTPLEHAMKQMTEYFAEKQPASQEPANQVTRSAPTEGQTEKPTASGTHATAPGNFSSMPDFDADNAGLSPLGEADRDPSGDTIMTPPPPTPKDEYPIGDIGVIASSSVTAPTSDQSDAPLSSQTQPPASSPTPEPRIAVYSPSTAPTPQAAQLAYNDADYEPSVEHAHSHQATLNRLAQNKRLQSDAEIAAAATQRQQALASIKTATIRVRFPDQMQVDVTISPSDTAEGLYATVRDMLERPELGFQLRYTGTKGAPVTLVKEGKEGKETLIRGHGMSGRVLVTMVWDASVGIEARSPVLKGSVRALAKELKVHVPGEEAGKGKRVEQGKAVEQKKEAGGKGKGDLEAKMKKFLGFKK